MTLEAAILAGGTSRRIGENKAFIELGGKPLVKWTIENLREVKIFNRIFLVANDLTQFLPIELELFADIFSAIGPLGGLHAALRFCESEYLFVTTCDMPFVKPEAVKLIIHNARGFDACVPVISDNFEPLLAVYNKRVIKEVENSIKHNERRIISFFQNIRVRKIYEDEIKEADPELRSFFNINFPEDLEKAQKIIQK